MTDEDDDDDHLIPLALEFMTSSLGSNEEEFVEHVRRRCQEELPDLESVVRLITILASFGGNIVAEWAEATDRTPDEVLQPIALEVAQEMYGDEST